MNMKTQISTDFFRVHFLQPVNRETALFDLSQHISRKEGKLSERMFPVPQSLLNNLTQFEQSTRHHRPVPPQCHLKQTVDYTCCVLQHLHTPNNQLFWLSSFHCVDFHHQTNIYIIPLYVTQSSQLMVQSDTDVSIVLWLQQTHPFLI